MRTTFAVGRVTRTTTEITVVERTPGPIAGPWRLRAVVRSRAAERAVRPEDGKATVH